MQDARQKITELLEQSIGLKASSIGVATLDRAVHTRMRVMGSQDVAAYLDRLSSSLAELRQLVEEVVVPETWFFRDQEPFTFLAEYIVHAEKDLSKDFFRILSLPCSTGEEPYSVVMTLLLAGLAPSAFYIDAVDVSERVLARARLGVYRENSFRTKDLSFRDIFFAGTAEGFVLQKAVHDKVRFLQGNIIQPGFTGSLGRYDVVFCRNVLIYFSEEAQRQVLEALYHMLLPGGLLFTGHAEASLLYNTRMFSVTHSKAFAFRRQELRPHEDLWQVPGRDVAAPVVPSLPVFPILRTGGGAPRQVKAVLPPRGETELAQVRQLADEGRLEEAARLSDEHLRRHGPSPEWYYLLGIIRDSQGQREEALKLLRKAVYLDPANVDSLIHLALLAERAGDLESAANYKRRARKLREGGVDLWQKTK